MSLFCELSENCNICMNRYNMPYYFCCLEECGEHEFCGNCTHEIYSQEEKNVRIIKAEN